MAMNHLGFNRRVSESACLKPSLPPLKRQQRLLFTGENADVWTPAETNAPFQLIGTSSFRTPAYHWRALLRAQNHAARGAQFLPSHSQRHYGAMVILSDGSQALGTNVEASRQVTQCDLKVAMATAFNQSIQAPHDERRTALAKKGLLPQAPTVKAVYLANAALDAGLPTPCADCQEWLNSDFCTPETEVISLEPAREKNGPPVVRIRTVSDLLPLYQDKKRISKPSGNTALPAMSDIPIILSPQAKRVMVASPLLERANLQLCMQAAIAAYEAQAADSSRRPAVAVKLVDSVEIHTGTQFHWSSRWFQAADLATVAHAQQAASQASIQSSLLASVETRAPRFAPVKWLSAIPAWFKPQPESDFPLVLLGKSKIGKAPSLPPVQLIAYYGDTAELPPITSLGRLGRQPNAQNILFLTRESNTLQVRTLADYMPELYKPPAR